MKLLRPSKADPESAVLPLDDLPRRTENRSKSEKRLSRAKKEKPGTGPGKIVCLARLQIEAGDLFLRLAARALLDDGEYAGNGHERRQYVQIFHRTGLPFLRNTLRLFTLEQRDSITFLRFVVVTVL